MSTGYLYQTLLDSKKQKLANNKNAKKKEQINKLSKQYILFDVYI